MIFKRLKEKVATQLNAKDKEFLPAILEVTETPASPVGRMVLWSLFAVVLVGLGWSIFGHVDEVAVASGKLIPIGNVKVIQSEDKGLVKRIAVKDGEHVKAGQVLMELDRTVSEANMNTLKIRSAQLQLEMERLTAEQTSAPFNPTMRDGLQPKDIEFQSNIYLTRANDYRARLNAAQQAMQQNQAAMQAASGNIAKYQQIYLISQEQEDRIEKLVQQNAVALFVLLNYRSQRIETQRNLAAQEAELARATAAFAQSQEALTGVTTAYQSDASARLLDARKQWLEISEELKKAERQQNLATIVAPIDGRVNQLAIHTVGGIVTEAQPLMTIVPDEATLELEAWAANKDIGFIHKGQEAEIKIETFNFQKFGTVKAVVSDVSPDATEDKDKGRVFRVLLTLDKNNVLVNDNFVELAAGMSATADIKIRQKRIIEYFLDPFKKYQNEALRER